MAKHPKASVFHTPEWLEALRRTYRYEPVAFTTSPPTGKLQNGLVFCRIRSWLTGQRMVSLPFSDHCEPLFDSADEFRFLIDYLLADSEHRDWRYMELRPVSDRFPGEPMSGGFQRGGVYYRHRLDLRPDLGQIFRGLHKHSVQRRIQRAQNGGVGYQRGNSAKLLDEFYKLFVAARARRNLPPQPYAWFRNLISCTGNALEIRVAYRTQAPIAAVMTLRFRDTILYQYGCRDPRYKNLGGLPYLLWKAIEESKAEGASCLDLGRSETDDGGLVAFKDHWASRLPALTCWRFPAADGLAKPEPWKLRMARRILASLPESLLSRSGKLIYRHIG